MVGECVEGECVKEECDVGGERKGWEGEGGNEEGERETDFTPPRLKEVQVDARGVKCEEGHCRRGGGSNMWW